MAKGLSYLSVKCLRDSTGAVYVAAIGSLTDPVVALAVNSEQVKFNMTRLSSGHTQIVARLTSNPKALKYTVTFKSGKTETKNLPVPTDKQKLSVPFDSLTTSFSETKDINSQTFSFTDTLSYPEGKGQRETVIYPASTSEKLDTSSKIDFYYVSDGTLAYVASNDLQNQFLNNLKYTPSGTTSDSVGKFEGGTKNKSLAITTSSVTDTNVLGIEGPVVFGEVVAFILPDIIPPGGVTPLKICTSPTAVNYWLRSCVDETLPCVDNGLAFPQDCSNVALTPAIINEYSDNYIDGGCCDECDNDLVYTFTDIGDAAQDTANGSITVTVTSLSGAATGLISYALFGTPDNPDLSFSTVSVNLADQALPYTITYTNLFPGVYSLKVDGEGLCADSYNFTIPEKEDIIPDTTYACTDATAINYDSGAGLTNVDELCVFCDAVTGKFVAGGENGFTAPFPDVLSYIDPTIATSSPTGTSLTDGIINFAGEAAEWNLWNNDGVGVWNLGEDGFFQFVLSNNLNSTEALPFVHKLYKLNITDEEYIDLVLAAFLNGTSTKDIVVNNSTLIATQTGNGNQSHSFTDLAAGRYVVITQYNNDGTLDGDDEIEQCYNILGLTGSINVGQSGCTDPNALNYNSDATIDDGSCNYPEPEEPAEGCGVINLGIKLECGEDYYGNKQVNLVGISPIETNPNLAEVLNAGQFTYTQGPLIGEVFPFYVYNADIQNNPGFPQTLLSEYFYSEVFCHDQTNNTQLHLDNWQFNEGWGPNYMYGPLQVHYMYQPYFGDNANFINFSFYGGANATYTLFDSNGNPPSLNQAGVLNNHPIVNLTINYADGTSETIEQPLGRWFGGTEGFPGNGSVLKYIYANCNSTFNTNSTAEPISYSYNYNWGSFDNPEYTYQSDILFFQGGAFIGENGGAVCCDPNEVTNTFECTDPTASNYCCPEGTEGVITDNTLCEYPEEEERPGCTDPLSSNFDPLATIDDGSCPPVQGSGSWFCSNAAAGECEFIEGTIDGYTTQAECEEFCLDIDPDDCLELSNWVNTNSGGMNATTTAATGVYNETAGFCDIGEGGSITINIPSTADLNIVNPNGVLFVVQINQTNSAGFITSYASYYENGQMPFGSSTGINPVLTDDPAGFLSLSDYQGGTYTFNNLTDGCWGYSLTFYSDIISTPFGLLPTNPNTYCEGFGNTACIDYTCDIPDGEGGGEIIIGCTDPEAENYNPDAEVEDGTCNYPCDPCEGECLCPDGTYNSECCTPDPQSGCTDSLANNYNPNATLDDGSCEYDVVGCTGPCCDGGCGGDGGGGGDVDDGTDSVIPGCTPQNMDSLLQYNDQCITTSGNRFYTKLLTGLGDDCSTMEAWKMIIIQEILNRKGLPCVYNCSDESTIQIGAATNDCAARWEDSGSIYWNPTDAVGFGLGTIVKRANGGLGGVIYIAVSTSGLTIDPFSSDSNSGWKKCVTIKAPTDNSDYLEKFVSFAKSYCRDCGIPPYTQETETDGSQVSVEVTSGFTVGGSPVTNDGVSYGPPQ
jgi:uncharacterized protein (DUF2141 family)